MGDVIDFSPADIRLMQGLAGQVWAVRPELTNNECTVGELAWVYGKDHALVGDTWRRQLWREGGDVVGWGWLFLPYRVLRSDGEYNEFTHAYLAWQVHPDRPGVLDDVLDWADASAGGVELRSVARAVDADALARLAAHGYSVDERTASDDGYWLQMNRRDLADVPEPVLPDGFRFRTAAEVGAGGAVRAHRDAWHPSSFTEVSYANVRPMWPYRDDLHVLVEAPDGTLAATAMMWWDEANRTAEFEPVGTHAGFRQRHLGSALLYHGMRVVRAAGADTMIVSCLGAPAYPAAKALYYGVGFREFTRDVPQVKRR
ncbi:MAG TPA: GNAT family N-acetyltransferase [Pseudonocardiaceae bacterium]|jgi:hypothetical protein